MNNVHHSEDHVRRPLQDAAELETLAQDTELELRPKMNNNCNGGKAPDEPQLGFLPAQQKTDPDNTEDEDEEEEEPKPPPDNGASFLIILFFYFQVKNLYSYNFSRFLSWTGVNFLSRLYISVHESANAIFTCNLGPSQTSIGKPTQMFKKLTL